MSEISIQDTGFIKTDNSGTQGTTKANSGNVITIKTAEFIPILKRNINNNPELGLSTPSEVNLGSLENMKFKLRCRLKKGNSSDMAKVVSLLDLVSTNGYKFLWYDFTNASLERNSESLIFNIASNPTYGDSLTAGEQSLFSISSDFKTLHVIFTAITPRETGMNDIIVYDLDGVILPVEASLI